MAEICGDTPSKTLKQVLHEQDGEFPSIFLSRTINRPSFMTNCLGHFTFQVNHSTEVIVQIDESIILWENEPHRLLSLVDVTFQEKATEKLREMDLNKTRLLRTVSHEFKTPLNAIMGSLSLMSKANSLDGVHKYLCLAQNASELLLSYVSDLLDYFQLRTNSIFLETSLINVGEIVRKTIDLVQTKADDKGIVVNIDLPNEELWVINDLRRLQQILLNLLTNAIKFSFTDSKIDIRVQRAKPEVSMTENDDSFLKVSIVDYGLGISDENQKTLFQEFGRINNEDTRKLNPQGIGLGLWICKKFCSLIGGESGGISVESVPGKKTKFEFFICNINEEVNEEDLQSISDSEMVLNNLRFRRSSLCNPEPKLMGAFDVSKQRRNFTTLAAPQIKPCRRRDEIERVLKAPLPKICDCPQILIADDDGLNRMILTTLLEGKNFRVVSVCNGKEALEAIEERVRSDGCCKQFELVILDYEMPEMTGPECAKILREKMELRRLPQVPLVGYTAYSSDDDLNYFRECGVCDILPKPLTVEALSRCLSVLDPKNGSHRKSSMVVKILE
eukprot:CAMPEP_0115018814 /NCGR_PEP_ID=MMETSP0216-20121206/29059_1 /TAXON_ID=223996 /ORGANISM="Protocruzia adherens, Strain Boccale" /LENGTH=559 /DNA_ID=CAMNT_0002390139 /DNA_START=547 /DNA_END=2226 /DNA_ORIENTATION=-